MNFDDIFHIAWLHNRFITVFKESPNVDYLLKTRQMIKEKMRGLTFPPPLKEGADGLLSFDYEGKQP